MLLYASLFILLISFVLAFNNYKINYNAMILASLFFMFAVFGLVNYAISYSKSVFWITFFYNFFMPFMYLKGPFLYFYIRGSLKEKRRISRKDWLHFIPAVVSLIAIVPYIITPYSYKVTVAELIIHNPSALLDLNDNIFFSPKFNIVTRPLVFLAYTLYCIYYLISFKLKPSNKDIYNKQLKVIYNWLYTFLFLLLLTISFYLKLCLDFIANHNINQYIMTKWYFNTAGFLISLLALAIIFFPNVLYGIPNFKEISSKKIKKRLNKLENGDSHEKSNPDYSVLSEVDNSLVDLGELIKKHLLIEKPFLNPNFTVSDLAIQLKVRELHVLYCFNTVLKIRFTKMKNQMRVEYAKELLTNFSSNNLTIDAIGQESGFATRSNFYNTFKVEAGCTPTEYLKSVKDSEK